jgi:hypothetical protein
MSRSGRCTIDFRNEPFLAHERKSIEPRPPNSGEKGLVSLGWMRICRRHAEVKRPNRIARNAVAHGDEA